MDLAKNQVKFSQMFLLCCVEWSLLSKRSLGTEQSNLWPVNYLLLCIWSVFWKKNKKTWCDLCQKYNEVIILWLPRMCSLWQSKSYNKLIASILKWSCWIEVIWLCKTSQSLLGPVHTGIALWPAFVSLFRKNIIGSEEMAYLLLTTCLNSLLAHCIHCGGDCSAAPVTGMGCVWQSVAPAKSDRG